MSKIALDQSTKDAIIDGWNKNMSIEEMARLHNTHTIKISDAVKEHFGGSLPRRKRKCRVFSPEEEAQMVGMYRSGRYSAKEIYSLFKTYDDNLVAILKKHGIEYEPLHFAKVDSETEAQIVDMYKHQGMTTLEIPRSLDLPYQRVRKILLKHGLLDGKSKRVKDRYPPELVDAIVKAYQDQNINVMDLSKSFNLSYASVRGILLRSNVSIRKNKEVKRAPTPEKVDRTAEIVTFFKSNGEVMSRTAEALSVSQGVVKRALESAGLYKSSRYNHNHDYFSKIDSHEKAYILGFWLTDGCNHAESGSISMTLQYRDYPILEEILKRISPEKSVRFFNTPLGARHGTIAINSWQMSKDLTRLGIVQNKTFKIKEEDWMTGEFSNSAILGMMDGDGSFYHRSRMGRGRLTPEESWTFSFIGMKPVCEMMKRVFRDKLGINGCVSPHTRYKGNLEKPLCTIRVYGNRQNQILMEWLYRDCPIYLKRKHDNYLAMLEFLRTKRVNQFG